MKNNFKDLKDAITKAVFESVITGTKSKDFKKFVAEVKKSPILKEQLDIYNLVENEKFDNQADATFIFERAMRVFEKYTAAEVEAANKSIVESFGGQLDESEEIYRCIKGLYCKDAATAGLAPTFLHVKAIIREMVGKTPVITEATEVKRIPTKKEIKRAIDILNEKFSFLDEREKTIFKSFISKDELGKEKAYESLLSENLQLVKRKLYESEDSTLDETLNQIVTKLNEDKYSPEKNINDFVKLLNLTKTLY